LILASDITEIRAAHQALQRARDELEFKVEERTADLKTSNEALAAQTEELARSNAELEQFAYVASHDLQEPLRMITNYIMLLARRYKGRLDEDADDFIDFTVEGATRMKTLIDDLLTYSRAQTRGKVFEPVDCGRRLDFRRQRQRHRYRAAIHGAHIHGLSAPAHAEGIPRDGYRLGRVQKDCRAPWRSHLGRITAGQRIHFLLFDSTCFLKNFGLVFQRDCYQHQVIHQRTARKLRHLFENHIWKLANRRKLKLPD
jgi:signal transduction histidine kinase